MSKEELVADFKSALQANGFAQYIKAQHENGHLKEILPDVDKLFDTSERVGNARNALVSEQVLDVLEQAEHYGMPAKCKYGLLLYTVSKADTPEHLQPFHPVDYGYLSKLKIRGISQELAMPKDYSEFAQEFATNHQILLRPDRLNEEKGKEAVAFCAKSDENTTNFAKCAFVYSQWVAKSFEDRSYSDQAKANTNLFVEKVKEHRTNQAYQVATSERMGNNF